MTLLTNTKATPILYVDPEQFFSDKPVLKGGRKIQDKYMDVDFGN
jgi:hypothetical protein